MSLLLLIGGARSGKSALALSLAEESGAPVTFVATGQARDYEMRVRIEAHRRERPSSWETVEAPTDVGAAFVAASPSATIVLDCVTLWVANLQERAVVRDAVLDSAAEVVRAAADRPGLTIAVTNEVGLGIVPATPLGRAYRDLLGEVNRVLVGAADEAWFVVAGKRLRLE
jgi:adenosyl cobinamide kinase/adenosyl cobinamide phosphate guanylyltransferase